MIQGTRRDEWAQLGARTRLAEIEQEQAAILQEFPELRGQLGEVGEVPRIGGQGMSRSSREATSARMKKYWADRKAGQAVSAKVSNKGKKRGPLSPAWRAKLALAAKRRWAEAKKAGRTSL